MPSLRKQKQLKRTTRSATKALNARLQGPPSLTNLPTEIKEFIVEFVGVRLERRPGAPPTSETRRTLKSLALIDKVYAMLVRPYLFQAVRCAGQDLTSYINFHDNVLPRYQEGITSLLFHRGTAGQPTSEVRNDAARITGTSHEESDGEEIFGSLMANLIDKLPRLNSVAFDFHPSQPCNRVQRYERGHRESQHTNKRRSAEETPKTRFPSYEDPVLKALQLKWNQITSLDITLDSCPQSGYGALAKFLNSFCDLKSIRLSNTFATRFHDANLEAWDESGNYKLWSSIMALDRLESLSLVHAPDLVDDSLCTHGIWPGWDRLPLKYLTIIGADHLGIGNLIDFTNSFAYTLEHLTLSECPREPPDSFNGCGSTLHDRPFDDQMALEYTRFVLPRLESLTLGRQSLYSDDLFPLTEYLNMRHVTFGTCHEYGTNNFYAFAEKHKNSLKSMKIRVEENWSDGEALRLQEDLQKRLNIRCDLSWRKKLDGLDDFHWPVDPVFA
ncbi:hypothetical protein P7C70_g1597, partial [Phenoliferia sp. Uapishka_3]